MSSTKKKSAKKTVARKTVAPKVATPEVSTAVQDQRRAFADAFGRGAYNSRQEVDAFLLGMNDPNAFTVLEKLRARWVELDAAAVAAAAVHGGMTINVYKDKAGGFRWRAVAGNGEIMADSGESYTTQTDAERARSTFIALVKTIIV